MSALASARYGLNDNPHAQIEIRSLPPELAEAAWVLWSRYETLDLQMNGSLREAEALMLTSLPIIEGYEAQLRALAKSLVADLKDYAAGNAGKRFQIRFLGGTDALQTILSAQALSRVAVIPVSAPYSLHTETSKTTASELDAQLNSLPHTHFKFIAAPSAVVDQLFVDENDIHRQEPLSGEALVKFRAIGRLIAQAMVEAANMGMEAQASLATSLGAIRSSAIQLLSSIAAYEKQNQKEYGAEMPTPRIGELAREVRVHAVGLEQALTEQMGNGALSPSMHQALRASLQDLKQIKNEASPAPVVQSLLVPRPEIIKLEAIPVARNDSSFRGEGVSSTPVVQSVAPASARAEAVSSIMTAPASVPIAQKTEKALPSRAMGAAVDKIQTFVESKAPSQPAQQSASSVKAQYVPPQAENVSVPPPLSVPQQTEIPIAAQGVAVQTQEPIQPQAIIQEKEASPVPVQAVQPTQADRGDAPQTTAAQPAANDLAQHVVVSTIMREAAPPSEPISSTPSDAPQPTSPINQRHAPASPSAERQPSQAAYQPQEPATPAASAKPKTARAVHQQQEPAAKPSAAAEPQPAQAGVHQQEATTFSAAAESKPAEPKPTEARQQHRETVTPPSSVDETKPVPPAPPSPPEQPPKPPEPRETPPQPNPHHEFRRCRDPVCRCDDLKEGATVEAAPDNAAKGLAARRKSSSHTPK